MSLSRSPLKLNSLTACVLLVLLCCGSVLAQSDLGLELKEAHATLQASATRITEVEARLAKAKEQVNALAEALASANGDSQQARESYERLRIQMEGLGVAALDASNAGLQERLLTALSDMRLLESQKRSLATALMDLSEASLGYAKAAGPVSGVPKKELDAKLAQAEQALAKLENDGAPARESDLFDARVVSLKEDAGIAVLNVGSRHGVHTGTPFSIYRQDKPVARALVVDVRQDICGAVVQDLVSKDEPVKVGDICKVHPRKVNRKQVMEVKAITKYVRISDQKAREVAREIQGLPVSEALSLLNFVPKKAALLYGKTLRSAIANAENNHELDADDLYIKSTTATKGPMLKRIMPRARGSAAGIKKRMSHLTLVLAPKEDEEAKPAKKARTVKKAD